MTNTEILKGAVEDDVRRSLGSELGAIFEKRRITLVGVEEPAGDHEFDAVSTDGTVIAGIISSAPKTSGGRRNVGAVHHATGELYYLMLTPAKRKFLICTNAAFKTLMDSVTQGRLAKGIEIKHIPLTADLEAQAKAIREAASHEMRQRPGGPPARLT